MQAGDVMDTFCRNLFQNPWRPEFLTNTFQNSCLSNMNYADSANKIAIITNHVGFVKELATFDHISMKFNV